MAVLAEAPNNAAMESRVRETKQGRKRSKKASIEDNSTAVSAKPVTGNDSNHELIDSNSNKRNKKQKRTKEADHAEEVVAEKGENEAEKLSTDSEVTEEGPEQGYCVVPSAKRLLLLYSFLKRNLSKKIVVICSSRQAAKFYCDLLKHMKFDSTYFYGRQDQWKPSSVISRFAEARNGMLFTDIPVEALDVSDVDWLVQYDPPDIPKDYAGAKENVLTILIPEELEYLTHLKEANVRLKEYKFDMKQLSRGEPQLEKLVAKNHHLYTSAVMAYRSYILAYNTRQMKNVFDPNRLDVLAVAASFCFSNPPKINLG